MNEKRKAAAVSAVLYHIRSEQEAAAMMASQPSGASQRPSVSSPTLAFKPWGMSGRQEQMQIRNLMQLRTFKKLR